MQELDTIANQINEIGSKLEKFINEDKHYNNIASSELENAANSMKRYAKDIVFLKQFFLGV